jgi:hypothetical protein
MLYKHKVHDGRAVAFYMDIRAAGKGYDEFSRRAIEEDGAEYIRGRVSRIFRDGDAVKVWASTRSGERVVIDADMVVLATTIHDLTEGTGPKLAERRRHGFINRRTQATPVETTLPGSSWLAPANAATPVQLGRAGRGGRGHRQREPIGCMRCELVCPTGGHRERGSTVDGPSAVNRLQTLVCARAAALLSVCLSRVSSSGVHRRADLQRDRRASRVGVTPTAGTEPRITAFVCNWCTPAPTWPAQPPAHGEQRAHHPSAAPGASTHCSSSRPLRRGAGVIVSNCHPPLPPPRAATTPAGARRVPRHHGVRRRRCGA